MTSNFPHSNVAPIVQFPSRRHPYDGKAKYHLVTKFYYPHPTNGANCGSIQLRCRLFWTVQCSHGREQNYINPAAQSKKQNCLTLSVDCGSDYDSNHARGWFSWMSPTCAIRSDSTDDKNGQPTECLALDHALAWYGIATV